jgi:hypothetical protein
MLMYSSITLAGESAAADYASGDPPGAAQRPGPQMPKPPFVHRDLVGWQLVPILQQFPTCGGSSATRVTPVAERPFP